MSRSFLSVLFFLSRSTLGIGKLIPPDCLDNLRGWNFTWNLSPADITYQTDRLIKNVHRVYDEIAATAVPTWRNIAWRLALFEADYLTEHNILSFLQYVSPSKDLRDASYAAAQRLSDLHVELEMHEDVFKTFVAVQSVMDTSVPEEVKRYIDRKVQNGKRNGLHLDEKSKQRIESLSKEQNQLCNGFVRAILDDNTVLEFDESELSGCPEDFITGLTKLPNGKRQITLKYPHYMPASQKVSNPETRRKLEKAFNSRCAKGNKKILERVLEIRNERANILGFSTHADFILQIRMAKNASTVAMFLKELGDRLESPRVKETERLLELKMEESRRLNFDYVDQIEPSDLRYYVNMVAERDFYVDKQELKKYFPLETVKAGILRMYQDLLGLDFVRVATEDVWHPDVEMYSVSDRDTRHHLGYFYLDLHSRENKYSHAAVFSLQLGCLHRQESASAADGECQGEGKACRQVAVAAMVANFPERTKRQPEPYLLHDDVESFFHEFGHLMHELCARADLAVFSGANVETDFLECPSQMLENWVWTEAGLKAMLGDDLNGMPSGMLQRLVKSRSANAALFYTRQLLLASYDQAIHTNRWKEDPLIPYIELSKKWLNITPTPGTFMPATFGHLCGGYDSSYYGYLWSEVFSADLFETRFRWAPDGGCLSKSVGREYREKILRPGGSKDAIDMLKDFLGREPNNAAFLSLLGLEP